MDGNGGNNSRRQTIGLNVYQLNPSTKKLYIILSAAFFTLSLLLFVNQNTNFINSLKHQLILVVSQLK